MKKFKKLEEAQVLFPTAPFLCPSFNLCCLRNFLWTGASTSLATTSSKLESLRSAHKDLEAKLKVAEEKKKLRPAGQK
jgi:hypothetical protein